MEEMETVVDQRPAVDGERVQDTPPHKAGIPFTAAPPVAVDGEHQAVPAAAAATDGSEAGTDVVLAAEKAVAEAGEAPVRGEDFVDAAAEKPGWRTKLLDWLEAEARSLPEAFTDPQSLVQITKYHLHKDLSTREKGGFVRGFTKWWSLLIGLPVAAICDTLKWAAARFVRALFCAIVLVALGTFVGAFLPFLVPDLINMTTWFA